MEPTSRDAQTDEQFTPLAKTSDTPATSDDRWSWGAFSMHVYFVIAIRRYVLLVPLLLVLVPFLGPILFLGYMVYLGMKGRRMASESSTFASREEFIGFMKGIDHAGKIMFFIMIAAFAIGFVVAVTIMGALAGGALGGFKDLERERKGMLYEAQREWSDESYGGFEQYDTDYRYEGEGVAPLEGETVIEEESGTTPAPLGVPPATPDVR